MQTIGVLSVSRTVIAIIVSYPCEGGLTRLEVTPGGGLSAGIRSVLPGGGDMICRAYDRLLFIKQED